MDIEDDPTYVTDNAPVPKKRCIEAQADPTAAQRFFAKTDAHLVHNTAAKYLSAILDTGYILSNVDRRRNDIASVNEGNSFRTICDPYITPGKECDEAFGVYCRLSMYGKMELSHNPSVCGIVISPAFLDKTSWHINTCENNGFVILDGKAPFGDCKKSIFTIAPERVAALLPASMMHQIHPLDALTPELYTRIKSSIEVVVASSIPLHYVEKIYFADPICAAKHEKRLGVMGIKVDIIF
jgi:hypothetical protein